MGVHGNQKLILWKIVRKVLSMGVHRNEETFLNLPFFPTTHEKFLLKIFRLHEHRIKNYIARAPLHCKRD